MTDSSAGRYANLVRYVRNWPAYFGQKRAAGFSPARFITRGTALTFDVPTRELYLVFKEIFLTDFYSIRDWAMKLPQSPVVVDVGANAGYFDMLLLSRRPDTNVYAYEPIEKNFELFRQNIRLNPAVEAQTHLFNRAVTGLPQDEVTLFKEGDSDNSVTASVFQDFESHNVKSVTVKAISLSQILQENNLDHVDFLKLDCEGSEYPIVYDSPRAIWARVKAVFMEVHNLDEGKRNFTAMKQYMESVGYTTTAQLAKNGCYALYALR